MFMLSVLSRVSCHGLLYLLLWLITDSLYQVSYAYKILALGGGEDAIVWEGGYVDWKKKPAKKGQHGGMRAALFVLVVEVMENLSYLANASNLVLYLTQNMHFSLSKAANNVTDFMGTAFLLALLGGFLSDAFFTAYQIYIFSASLEFLASQSHVSQSDMSTLKFKKHLMFFIMCP
ncbi:NRT1/ PTR family protein 4.6 [Tanacetum coccineum]